MAAAFSVSVSAIGILSEEAGGAAAGSSIVFEAGPMFTLSCSVAVAEDRQLRRQR